MRFEMLLSDTLGRACIISFESRKIKRLICSALGAKIFAVPDAVDDVLLLNHELRSVMERTVPLRARNDSFSLFFIIIRSTTTTEPRIMIEI